MNGQTKSKALKGREPHSPKMMIFKILITAEEDIWGLSMYMCFLKGKFEHNITDTYVANFIS